MSKCNHCGYIDSGGWQECPACGQIVAPLPDAPAPFMTTPSPPAAEQTPPPVAAHAPYAASAPVSPGTGVADNPYAAPTTPGASPAAYAYAYSQPAMLPTSGKAIASMVLGICSIALTLMFGIFGILLGPLAIGLWASARNDFKQIPPAFKGQGLATAGLITGIIGLLFSLAMVALIAFVIIAASSDPHF